MRRAHRALCRGQELLGAVLLRAARAFPGRSRRPRGQWLRQRRAAATADGIRGGGAEADLDQPRRERRLMALDAVIASQRVARNARPMTGSAKQSIGPRQDWIASSQVLLAMTNFQISRTK